MLKNAPMFKRIDPKFKVCTCFLPTPQPRTKYKQYTHKDFIDVSPDAPLRCRFWHNKRRSVSSLRCGACLHWSVNFICMSAWDELHVTYSLQHRESSILRRGSLYLHFTRHDATWKTIKFCVSTPRLNRFATATPLQIYPVPLQYCNCLAAFIMQYSAIRKAWLWCLECSTIAKLI